jgi:hypothetical protein
MEIIPFSLARSSDEAIHAHPVINSLMQRDQRLSSPEKAPKIEKSLGRGQDHDGSKSVKSGTPSMICRPHSPRPSSSWQSMQFARNCAIVAGEKLEEGRS